MKKFSLFLILICVFAFFGCSTNKSVKLEATFSTNDVATLSIFSFNGKGESKYGIKNLGHSFLSITNNSTSNITIAGKEIEPNEEIYFGAWSLSVHFGIWYNVESNYIEFYNKYNGRVSVDKGITIEDIETISDFILTNDTWTPVNNCSRFAIRCWNSVAKESEKLNLRLVNTPTKLIKNLKKFENFEINKFDGEIIINEPEKCRELIWADINNLPKDMIKFEKEAINNNLNGVKFSVSYADNEEKL